jgi:hypothetical protein
MVREVIPEFLEAEPSGHYLFLENSERGGPGFATPASPRNRSIGVFEKNFQKFSEI